MAQDFLLRLWDGQLPGDGTLLIWAKQDSISRHVHEISEASAIAAKLAGRCDVYFGCALRRPGLRASQRGGTNDAVAIPALWVDLDTGIREGRKNYFKDRDDIWAFLRPFPHPTLVVDSGMGLQAYWAFKEAEYADSSFDRAALQCLTLEWQRRVCSLAKEQGIAVDSVHDLARVLRLPGTINHKYESRFGPLPVRLLEANGPRYPGPRDLLYRVGLIPTRHGIDCSCPDRGGQNLPPPVAAGMSSGFRDRPDVARLIAGSIGTFHSMSEGDASLAGKARHAGLALHQAKVLISERRANSVIKPWKATDERYLTRTVERVYTAGTGIDMGPIKNSYQNELHRIRQRATEAAVLHRRQLRKVGTSDTAGNVLCELSTYVRDRDLTSVAVTVLADNLAKTQRTVIAALAELRRAGCITAETRWSRGKAQTYLLSFLDSGHGHLASYERPFHAKPASYDLNLHEKPASS